MTGTMQFTLASIAVVASIFMAIVPSANAATCYSTYGCQTCESETSLYNARQYLCGGSSWEQSTSFQWGQAFVNLEGEFDSQQTCFSAFANIIEDCYGKRNGGEYQWQWDGSVALLDVNFCTCS
ncbi:hypothetical protein BD414DRAFT_478691 [Trametes punicea]|nr:hypothetical protein BD414DRAFT_478691 [Trametes punicea]